MDSSVLIRWRVTTHGSSGLQSLDPPCMRVSERSSLPRMHARCREFAHLSTRKTDHALVQRSKHPWKRRSLMSLQSNIYVHLGASNTRTYAYRSENCDIGLHATASNCPQKSQLLRKTKCLTPKRNMTSCFYFRVAWVMRGPPAGRILSAHEGSSGAEPHTPKSALKLNQVPPPQHREHTISSQISFLSTYCASDSRVGKPIQQLYLLLACFTVFGKE